jgi:signal transduction histidine kinase
LAKDKCISFDNLIDKDREIFVNGDPEKIRPVFLNVLENAIRYNKKGGKVALCLTQEGPEKFCVAIRDTGDGIPEDKYEKIFDPLYRLENHVKNCIDGVGVGLTVVKKFMTIMRGRVYVESKLGGGTCFTLEFEKWIGKDSV